MPFSAQTPFHRPGPSRQAHALLLALAALGLAACGGGDGVNTAPSARLNIVPDSIEVHSGNSVEVPLELIDSYWFGLIMWDIALTTLWFAALQIRWRRQNRRVETTGTSEGVIKRLARRLREIGYREPV